MDFLGILEGFRGAFGAVAKGASKARPKARPKAAPKARPKARPKRAVKKGKGGDDGDDGDGSGAGDDGGGSAPTGFSGGSSGGIAATSAAPGGTNINIQISGADMSASSGVFSERIGMQDEPEPIESSVASAPVEKGVKSKRKPKAKPKPKPKAKAKAKAGRSRFVVSGSDIASDSWDIEWSIVAFTVGALAIFLLSDE